MDNYPLESVYYRLALIYLSKRDLKSSSENLAKALTINPKFQYALDFKESINYEKISFHSYRRKCHAWLGNCT